MQAEAPTGRQTALDLARASSDQAVQARAQELVEQQRMGSRRGLEVWQAFLAGDRWHLAGRKKVTMWVAAVSGWLMEALLLGDQENLATAVDTLTKAHETAVQAGSDAESFVSVLLETAMAAQLRVQQVAWLQEQGPQSNVGSVLRAIAAEPSATTHRLRCSLSIKTEELEYILRSLQDGEWIVGEQGGDQVQWTATPLGCFTVQQWQATA